MSESMVALFTGITLISSGLAVIATCFALAAAGSARSNAKKLKRIGHPVRRRDAITTVAPPASAPAPVSPAREVAS